MRKFILFSFLLCSISLSAQYQIPQVQQGTIINLQVIMNTSVIIPGSVGSSHPKAPLHIQAPDITLDGSTLFIYSSHPDYVLQLLDADETVVFETYVSAETYQVGLPTSLLGEHELQLQTGTYAFVGYVEL